jgi:hypothetical protein
MNKDTLILVPSGLGIDHKVDERLRILEAEGFQVWRQAGYSSIDQCRNKMIYNFLKYTNFKSILWIDGDVIFSSNDVYKLIESDKDIIAGTYPFKGHPELTFVPLTDDPIYFGTNSIIEVKNVATGFLFIKREVIENVIQKLNIELCNTSFDNPSYPLFTPIVKDGVYVGEDFGFCERARQVGYKIYLDTSIQLLHVGRYEYGWKDVINQLKPISEFKYNTGNELPFSSPSSASVYNLKDKLLPHSSNSSMKVTESYYTLKPAVPLISKPDLHIKKTNFFKKIILRFKNLFS